MNISLALSGGGFRAMVFHLGVLARLSCENRMEDVRNLSSVSGGSLCAGLVFSLNHMHWPGSQAFLQQIEPAARHLLTTTDLQGSLIKRALGNFWSLFGTRADDLATLIREQWGISARVCDLPVEPRWMINATCYETGKNWRFERARMGDYRFGYTNDTDLLLAEAMAASAGFPILIGPLTLKTRGRQWFEYQAHTDDVENLDQAARWDKKAIDPRYPEVHLWDGGAYDNHGLEAFYDYDKGWHHRFGFLIVSDAAGQAGEAAYQKGLPALLRLCTGIMMNQVRSLRTGTILGRLSAQLEDEGVFLQVGNTWKDIIKDAGDAQRAERFSRECLPEQQVRQLAAFATTIRRLSHDEYTALYRHGYEVADATLNTFYPGTFEHIPYSAAQTTVH